MGLFLLLGELINSFSISVLISIANIDFTHINKSFWGFLISFKNLKEFWDQNVHLMFTKLKTLFLYISLCNISDVLELS